MHTSFNLFELKAFLRLQTEALIETSSERRFTAEPMPTPEAPTEIAIGIVTEDKPEAHRIGTLKPALVKASEIAWTAAKEGAAFSINPNDPGLKGFALVPPSV